MTEPVTSQPIRYVVVLTDIEGFGRQKPDGRERMINTLMEAQRGTALDLALPWTDARVRSRGDGLLVAWAADHEVAVVDRYPRAVAEALRKSNRHLRREHQVRVRMSITAGFSRVIQDSMDGDAVVDGASLVDSDIARRALASTDRFPLVLLVSDRIYEEIVEPELVGGDTAPERFLDVNVKDKRRKNLRTWITVPLADRSDLQAVKNSLSGWPKTRRAWPNWVVMTAAALAVAAVVALGVSIPRLFEGDAPPDTPTSSPTPTETATAVAGSPGVAVWDPWNGRAAAALPEWAGRQGASAVAFSPEFGELVAVGGADGVVREYDARAPELKRTLSPGGGGVVALAYNDADKSLAVGTADGAVRMYGTDGDAPIRSVEHAAGDGPVRAMTINAKRGDTLAVAGDDGVVRAYDARAAAPTWTIPAVEGAGAVQAVAFRGDGDTFATGSRDGVVRLYDGRNGSPARVMDKAPQLGGGVLTLAFNPAGDTLAAAGPAGAVVEYDANRTRQTRVRAAPAGAGAIRTLVYNAGGDTLVVGSDDGGVRMYAARNDGQGEPFERKLGTGPVRALAFNPPGGVLVAVGDVR